MLEKFWKSKEEFVIGKKVKLPVVEGMDQFEQWNISSINKESGEAVLIKNFIEDATGQAPSHNPNENSRREKRVVLIESLKEHNPKGSF
jgi:hypothetical protein